MYICAAVYVMKKILLCAATINEVKTLLHWLKQNTSLVKKNKNYFIFQLPTSVEFHLLISGVGMVATAFWMGCVSNEKFDIAINIGICGAFDRNFNLGECVIVKEDIFSEWGAEAGTAFLKASEINLGNELIIPKKFKIPKHFLSLKKVRGITVNTVHGNKKSIQKITSLYKPQVESMEGAAFYYACNQNKWKCFALRSISNYVEERNKNNWNIPLAVQRLNTLFIQYINNL